MKSTIILLLYSTIWLVFTQGSDTALVIGLPVILAAILAARCLTPLSTKPISLIHLIQFIPYFLIESIKGGVDVTVNTLAFNKKINSGFFYYQCNLKSHSERTFFNNCVSMLPGTLTVDLSDNWIEIHSINLNHQTITDLIRLENLVRKLFLSQERI